MCAIFPVMYTRHLGTVNAYEQRIVAPRICSREILSAANQERSAVQSFKLELKGLYAHLQASSGCCQQQG